MRKRMSRHLGALLQLDQAPQLLRTLEAKARGVKLGNPHGIRKEAAARGRKLGQDARSVKARKFALMMYGTIRKLQGDGLSLNAIAKRLNEEGTLTASGRSGSWTATAVRNIIRQAAVG